MFQYLRQYNGDYLSFWKTFMEQAVRFCDVQAMCLLQNSETQWQIFMVWPGIHLFKDHDITNEALIGIANQTFHNQKETVSQGQTHHKKNVTLVATPIHDGANGIQIGIFLLNHQANLTTVLSRFSLISDIPDSYHIFQDQLVLTHRVALFAQTLNLMVMINDEDRFLSAVMTLCNELATHFQCTRVALGWIDGRYIRIQGMSHIEHFDPKMGAVQALESAMEEALDQNEEIVIPSPENHWNVVIRSHESYTRKFGGSHMVSLPLRIKNLAYAVISCERTFEFKHDDIRGLRMICDQVMRRLFDLKQSDRWLGARFVAWTRKKLSKFFGIEHTFAKLVGIICTILLIYIFVGYKDYRVKAPCILKTDNLAYIQAPFNGYISDVSVQIGDIVRTGDLLLELDTRDLKLREAAAIADMHQFARAEEKARSQDHLADMRIAQARLEKAQVELERIHFFLNQAIVKAPFSGVIVQGERQKLLGAPVREGDVMYKIAAMKDYYIQLDVNEQDVHDVNLDQSGQIAFLSRPDQKISFRIFQISYSAKVKEKENIFEIRASLTDKPENWWRPGMSGIGHIEVGKRRIIWILSHRTIDYIRLYIWW